MKYLVAVSIGPVQDFIAAARRTADLFAGSEMLMSLVQAIAEHLESRAQLIFPASSKHLGANKLLFCTDESPKELLGEIKVVAGGLLKQFWEITEGRFNQAQRDAIHHGLVHEQLGNFLEIYGAWVLRGSDYAAARTRVDALLASRKNLREFAQGNQSDAGIPKSSLDPSRASVVKDSSLFSGHGWRLKPTEAHDAISLIKRIHGAKNSERVIDTRTMARRATDPNAMPRENESEEDDSIPQDESYFAILQADGDRMGDLIGQYKDESTHQDFSKRLSKFATEVNTIVKKHAGFLVYSGGDDILALLPVNRAIQCSQRLADQFAKVTGGTLSAGIAIVHYKQPLSMSRAAAQAAEKDDAKRAGRDRLAVALHTRGGAPSTVILEWGQTSSWIDLQHWYAAKKVTRGVAFELQDLARTWQNEMGADALNAEVDRIRERKDIESPPMPIFASAKELETYTTQMVIARFLSGEGDENA
jgi:CRISPR-associated protein Cmr2